MQHVRIVRILLYCVLASLCACSDSDPGGGGQADAGAFPIRGVGDESDVSAPGPSAACTTDADCTGTLSHPCLTPKCNESAGQCFQAPVLDGSSCETGNACMKAEICMAGQCKGGQPISCDDQEPCTDDSCDPSLGCVHVTNTNCCEPLCTGKECGSDGCGGACGICGEGETCVNSVCTQGGCTPSCIGKECGDDGCGGVCGACGGQETCTNGQCVGEGPCTPACGTKVCGNDGCGGSCGTCPNGEACSGQGQCVGCTPNCAGKQCGDDGCGSVCGTCPMGALCDFWGQCDICEPDCAGKDCGDDGCGSTCGTCAGQKTCDVTGSCVDLSEGSSCEDPFVVTALPFVVEGDTTGYSGNYSFGDGACPNETWGQGLASPDHAYLFAATSSANYRFKLEVESGFWGALYIVSDCSNVDGTCMAGATSLNQFNPAEQVLYMNPGEFVYVIVDGYDSNWMGSAEQGAYTLTIEEDTSCAGACDGKECGDNGCGGFCGSCAGGLVCSPSFTCVDPGEGSTCGQPFKIASVPFTTDNTTEAATNDYSFDDDICPNESNGQGAGSPDHVYAFTAPSSGNYRFKLEVESLYWGSMYAMTSCGDVIGSCSTAGKTSSQWNPVELVQYVNAGDKLFLVVDGYDNNNDWNVEEGAYTLSVEEDAD
ncbi:MAG: hypothetical protein VX938_09660, partial [Myxococcota bacterium]|nr:hypothetical protein [Myxococcota bacterium]